MTNTDGLVEHEDDAFLSFFVDTGSGNVCGCGKDYIVVGVDTEIPLGSPTGAKLVGKETTCSRIGRTNTMTISVVYTSGEMFGCEAWHKFSELMVPGQNIPYSSSVRPPKIVLPQDHVDDAISCLREGASRPALLAIRRGMNGVSSESTVKGTEIRVPLLTYVPLSRR